MAAPGVAATERDLLDLLAEGERLSGPERAVLLAGGAGGSSLGERDRSILRLHADLFGPTVEARHICPACAEPAEVELAVAALEEIARSDPSPVRVHIDGYDVTCRLLTGADLIDAVRAGDPGAARRRLLDAVVLDARAAGRPVAPGDLPAGVVAAVTGRLAEADPFAEIRVDLLCPACGAAGETALDLAVFVWDELCERGRRVLWEVHVLAGAYGWSESDVLALPASRRAAYMAMVLGG